MKKAFVPICLYSNGFFLVKDNLRFFLHVFSDYSELLFVIVDKLYGNNLLIKDKVLDVEQAEKAYKERGEHIFLHVKNTIQDYAESHHVQTKYQIYRWNDIADRKDYDFMKHTLKTYPTSAQILLSPMFDKNNKNVIGKELADWVLKDKLNCRIQIQLHKILGVK